MPTGVDAFLGSVDTPTINPPPNWVGFTLKNIGSPQEGNITLSGAFSSHFHAGDVKQHSNGDLYIGGFDDDAGRKAALDFLRNIKSERPQMEIVFAVGPKSPGLGGLLCDGFEAALKKILQKPVR